MSLVASSGGCELSSLRRRTGYSMGANCADFTCSICQASVKRGGCEHVSMHERRMRVISGKVAYLQAQDFIGFETSSVDNPAYVYATNPNYL
jgi:hypothetical protein